MTHRPDARDRNGTVPDEIGLYGLGYYTQAILGICRDAGIRVAFVVDDRPETRLGHDPARVCLASLRQALATGPIHVWSEEEFHAHAARAERLPPLVASSVVGTPGGSAEEDPYLSNARRLRRDTRGRVALLHPVSLAPALGLPAYRKRIALFGFPGSGNILARQFLEALDERRDDPVPPAVSLVAALAEHYYRSTMALLRDLLGGLRPVAIELAAYQFPTANLTLALPDGEYALAEHLPCNRHLASYLYHIHGIPSRFAVDELTRLGTACFAVIRHPCETVLSWAAKLSRPPAPVLDHAAFFRDTLEMLAEWFRQMHVNADHLTVVRYEDLEARRTRPLRALADRLGVALRDEEVGPLYDRFLNRDLLPGEAPGHFYRGGNDKWRHTFRPRHVRQMQAAGFGTICERWGYDLSPPVGSVEAGPRRERGPSGQKSGVIPLDTPYGLTKELFVPEPFPLRVHSRSGEVNRFLRAALHGPEFLRHLSAGGLGPDSPPWVAPIPWDSLLPILLPGRHRSRWPGLTRWVQKLCSGMVLRD
jgi:hypothetical protein